MHIGAATQNIMVRNAALNPSIGAFMRHLISLILAVGVALPVAAWAGVPEPEPVEITHEGIKLKALIYRPEGKGQHERRSNRNMAMANC